MLSVEKFTCEYNQVVDKRTKQIRRCKRIALTGQKWCSSEGHRPPTPSVSESKRAEAGPVVPELKTAAAAARVPSSKEVSEFKTAAAARVLSSQVVSEFKTAAAARVPSSRVVSELKTSAAAKQDPIVSVASDVNLTTEPDPVALNSVFVSDNKVSVQIETEVVSGVRFVGFSRLEQKEGNVLSGFIRGSIIEVGLTKHLLEAKKYFEISKTNLPIQIIAEKIELEFDYGKFLFSLVPTFSERYVGNGVHGLVVRYVELNGDGNRNRTFAVKYTDPDELEAVKMIKGVSCVQVPSHPLSWSQANNTGGFVSNGFVTMSPLSYFDVNEPTLSRRLYVALVMPLYDGDLTVISQQIRIKELTVSPSEELKLIELIQEGLDCMYRKKLCYGDLKPANILFKRSSSDSNLIGVSIGDLGSDHVSSFHNPFVKDRGNTVELCRDGTRKQTLDFLMVMFATNMFQNTIYKYIDNTLDRFEVGHITKDSALSLAKRAIKNAMPHFLYLTESWGVS